VLLDELLLYSLHFTGLLSGYEIASYNICDPILNDIKDVLRLVPLLKDDDLNLADCMRLALYILLQDIYSSFVLLGSI